MNSLDVFVIKGFTVSLAILKAKKQTTFLKCQDQGYLGTINCRIAV